MSGKARYEPESRSAARLGAVQALYQMESAGTPVDGVIEEFVHHRFGTEVEGITLPMGDEAFFTDLLNGIVEHQVETDRAVNAVLAEGWKLTRIDATVRAILRAGAYELLHRPDVPPKVTIAEYVRLAESFFEGDEVGFVNGVLDKLAHAHRAAELSG
jgi:N utilization substance protein B